MEQSAHFEHDILISYAQTDDEPLLEGEPGWVSSFHRTLDRMVRQFSGGEYKIWRDPRLLGNDHFSDALPKTAVLVSIVSPSYLKSEWCIRELKAFHDHTATGERDRIHDGSRIFKVVKTAISREDQPSPLDELLGYEFFQVDLDSGDRRQFGVERGDEAQLRYVGRLRDLAYEIVDLLDRFHKSGVASHDLPTGEPVYLAETTDDVSQERDRIKSELRQLGHVVLPDRPLPRDAAEVAAAVEADLGRCCLAIHLLGDKTGYVPDGEQRSVIRIQNDIAARHSRLRAMPRLIWIPPGLVPSDARQAKFVEFVETDAAAQKGADVLRTNIEDLKSIVRDRLRQPCRHTEATGSEHLSDGSLQVYLVYDQCDTERARPLADHLFDAGFELVVPEFGGDESLIRQAHMDKLAKCDIVVVFQGDASPLWLSAKRRDLRKLPGYDGYRPKLVTAYYVGAPETAANNSFRTQETIVIRAFDEFEPKDVEPLLEAVKSAQRGSG